MLPGPGWGYTQDRSLTPSLVSRRGSASRPLPVSVLLRHRTGRIAINGEHDPFTPPGDGAAYRDKFTGKYQHRVLPVGHNVPQEAPQAFARAVVDVDHL